MKSTLSNAALPAKPKPSPVALPHDAQPRLHQRGGELQPYGTLTRLPLGLSDRVRLAWFVAEHLVPVPLVSSTDVVGEAE